MTFQESIRVCFSRYADFHGTASRSEYWWFVCPKLAYTRSDVAMPDENVRAVMGGCWTIAFARETAAFAESEHEGAYEREAKEHDLPLVRQRRG
jgi:hypothetical protein